MDYPICVRGSIHLQLFSLKGIVFHSLLLRIEMKESFSYCTACAGEIYLWRTHNLSRK